MFLLIQAPSVATTGLEGGNRVDDARFPCSEGFEGLAGGDILTFQTAQKGIIYTII